MKLSFALGLTLLLLPLSSSWGEVSGEDLLEQGVASLERGDAHRALQLLSAARKSIARPDRVLLPLVRAHMGLHDLKRARSLLETADASDVDADQREALWRQWASSLVELARREGRVHDQRRLVQDYGPRGRVTLRELQAWLDLPPPSPDPTLLATIVEATDWASGSESIRSEYLDFRLRACKVLLEAKRAREVVALLEGAAADPASPPETLLLFAEAREALDVQVAPLLDEAEARRRSGDREGARALVVKAAAMHPGSERVKAMLLSFHATVRKTGDSTGTDRSQADRTRADRTRVLGGLVPLAETGRPLSKPALGQEGARPSSSVPGSSPSTAVVEAPKGSEELASSEEGAGSSADEGSEERIRDPDVLYELAMSYRHAPGAGLDDRLHALGLFWQVGLGYRDALRHFLAVLLVGFWPIWALFASLCLFAYVLGRWARRPETAPVALPSAPRNEDSSFRAEFKGRIARLGTFVNRVKALSSCQTVKEVHEGLVEVSTRSFACSECEVFAVVGGGRKLELTAAAPNPSRVGASLPCCEDNVIGYAALKQNLLTPESIARDPHATGLKSKLPPGMVFALPIQVQGRCSCVVYLSRHRGEEAPEDFASLQPLVHVLASVASLAIRNAEAFELTQTKAQVAVRAAERREKLLSQVVAPQVAKRILQGGSRSGLESQKRRLTILFSDIRDFTSLSERLPPEEVVSLLNDYISWMTQAIFDHGGTLDKYWGDAIIAYYGAPEPMPDHAYQAVLTAQRMLQVQRILNHRWKSEGRPSLQTGIGINTADVIWGAIGSDVQMSYTVIGDGVNLASRLQSNAQGGQILVSETVMTAVGDRVGFRKLDPIQVKGKTGLIPLWDVIESGAPDDLAEVIRP